MRTLLVDANGVVVGTASPEIKPPNPDQLQYVEVPDRYYTEALDDLRDPDGRPKWQWTGSSLKRYRAHPFTFYLMVRTSDNKVHRAIATRRPQKPPDHIRLVTVDEATFTQVRDSLRHGTEREGDLAWTCPADTPTRETDPRPSLVIDMPDMAEAGQVSVNLQVLNAQGNPVAYTGEAPLLVTKDDGQPQRKLIRVVDGQASLTPNLAPGHYRVRSAVPAQFRVTGQTEIEVAERW